MTSGEAIVLCSTATGYQYVTPYTQLYDRSHYWLGTGTSIKCGAVKLDNSYFTENENPKTKMSESSNVK